MKGKKILIVGAGLSGLSLAALLKRKGLKPVVIEQCQKFQAIGYIIMLFPNAVRVLEGIGIAGELQKKSLRLRGYRINDREGDKIFETSFSGFEKRYGPSLEVERDILHTSLTNACKGVDLRMCVGLRSLKESKTGVNVVLSDGKKETFDMAVGADGLDSQFRKIVRPRTRKDYTGLSYWIYWIPSKAFSFPEKIITYWGAGKMVNIFPSRNRDHAAVQFLHQSRRHSLKDPKKSREFIHEHFHDFGGVVPKILRLMPEGPYDVFHHDEEEIHLREWSQGRAVLIGDAAHALSPVTGMNAAMAFEDSYVLADEISRSQNYQQAFHNYHARRFPRVHQLADWSRTLHRLIAVRRPFTKLRNALARPLISRAYYNFYDRFLEEQP